MQEALADTDAQLDVGAERLRACLALTTAPNEMHETAPDNGRRDLNQKGPQLSLLRGVVPRRAPRHQCGHRHEERSPPAVPGAPGRGPRVPVWACDCHHEAGHQTREIPRPPGRGIWEPRIRGTGRPVCGQCFEYESPGGAEGIRTPDPLDANGHCTSIRTARTLLDRIGCPYETTVLTPPAVPCRLVTAGAESAIWGQVRVTAPLSGGGRGGAVPQTGRLPRRGALHRLL